MNHVLDILSDSKDLRTTVIGIARQAGYAAGGAAVGGVMGGPAGALIGTSIGGVIGYFRSDPYDSMINSLRQLSDRDKGVLGQKVQQLVGAMSIDEFVRWIQSEGHRQLLLTLLQQAVKSS